MHGEYGVEQCGVMVRISVVGKCKTPAGVELAGASLVTGRRKDKRLVST